MGEGGWGVGESGRGVAGGLHGEAFWKKEGHSLDVGVSRESGYRGFQLWKWEITLVTMEPMGGVRPI